MRIRSGQESVYACVLGVFIRTSVVICEGSLFAFSSALPPPFVETEAAVLLFVVFSFQHGCSAMYILQLQSSPLAAEKC